MDVCSLTTTELINRLRLQLEERHISQNQFIKIYNINQTNFSRWMKGKKQSPKSIAAARAFLSDPNVKPSNLTIKLKSTTFVEVIPIILSKQHMMNKVIFIDLDNSENYMQTIMVDFERTNHIVGFLTKDKFVSSLIGYDDKEWFSLLYSTTAKRDAADILFTSVVITLDIKVNIDIKFVFVTKDHFVDELKNVINEKRKVEIISDT